MTKETPKKETEKKTPPVKEAEEPPAEVKEVSAESQPEDKKETVIVESAPPPVIDKTVILAFLLVFAVTVVVVGGIFISQQAIKNQAERKSCQCPSPSFGVSSGAEPSPSASASAKLDKATLKIMILNGNGVKGSATVLADFLKEKGYKEIETGNADTQDYTNTLIQIKVSKEKFLDGLKQDLAEKFASPSAKIDLEEEETSDAIITVGKK